MIVIISSERIAGHQWHPAWNGDRNGGGVVRDMLSAEVPLILRRGNIYPPAAIAGTSCYFSLEYLGVARIPASHAAMLVCGALRFASIWWGLQLPVFTIPEERRQR